jgi:hypothetical protein
VRYCITIFLLIISTLSLYAQPDGKGLSIHAIVYVDHLNKINQKDIRIAVDTLLHKIADTAELDAATLEYSNDFNKSLSKYIHGECEVLHLSSFNLMKKFPLLRKKTAQYWNFAKEKNKHLRNFYLLVRKDSSIKTLHDLIGARVAMTQFDTMQELYLDHLMLQHNKMLAKESFNSIVYNKKGSTSILNLYFKKVDVAIVSQHSYNIAIELNPQLKKDLKILDRSKEIYPANGVTLISNKRAIFARVFEEHSKRLYKTDFGKELLQMYQCVENFKFSADELDELYTQYQEYLRLKKRYEKK